MPNDVLTKVDQAVPCDHIRSQRDALAGIAPGRLLAPDEVTASPHGQAYLCARHFLEQTDPQAQH